MIFSKNNYEDVITVHPHNVGWLEKRLSQKELDYLWKCIDNRSKQSHKKELAGVIEESNLLIDKNDWFWENTLKPLIKKYADEFENLGNDVAVNQIHPYYLKSWWVNFQKENEFNPLHVHTGVYSFVIWMKIPTNHIEQNRLPISSMSKGNHISNFQFTYTDVLGKIRTYEYQLSKSDNGKMLFFPSKLGHQVYPFFNSTDNRITISGNITLNTAKSL